MRAAEHAPRGPFYLLIRRHCLAEIVERGGGVIVERPRVNRPNPKSVIMTLPKNTQRHRNRFEQQCLGFCVAL